MAVEARHLNFLPNQLSGIREIMNPIEANSVFYNNQMGYVIPKSPASTKIRSQSSSSSSSSSSSIFSVIHPNRVLAMEATADKIKKGAGERKRGGPKIPPVFEKQTETQFGSIFLHQPLVHIVHQFAALECYRRATEEDESYKRRRTGE